MTEQTWPILYKASSTGAIQFWEISVSQEADWQTVSTAPATITIRHGQLGTDSPQETTDRITEGKNQGKKNATSPYEQAVNEAQGKFDKMCKKGYVDDLARAQAGEDDLQGVDCMLAHKYSEHAEKIVFPAACQPKLDGIRCLTRGRDGTLWSRSQKPITSVPHILEVLNKVFKGECPRFDGELYNHAFKDNFEKIVSIVRQTKKVDPEHGLVEYHVYDLAWGNSETPFEERSYLLQGMYTEMLGLGCPIKIVPTKIVNSHDELMAAFREFRAQGYEGAMVRNLASPYEGKRSYHLQKVKEFDSAEFEIVAVNEGRGKLAGCAIFQCKSAMSLFDVKMEGSLEALKKYLTDEALWKGKQLEVQFQGYTGKNKVPRFPVGLRVRDHGL